MFLVANALLKKALTAFFVQLLSEHLLGQEHNYVRNLNIGREVDGYQSDVEEYQEILKSVKEDIVNGELITRASEDMSQITEYRFPFLNRLYDITGGNTLMGVSMYKIGEEMNLDTSSIDRITQYFQHEGFIKRMGLNDRIAITHDGVHGVENMLRSEPQISVSENTRTAVPVQLGENRMCEPNWLDGVKDGANRMFGFLQFDVQGHSEISESAEDSTMQKIKNRLHRMVRGTAYLYDGWELAFSGDGAVYIFYTEQGSATDQIVKAGLHILHELSFFNNMLQIDDLLSLPLILRLSCHRGEATFHRNEPGEMHGNVMNKFLKNERQISLPNSICITAEVYRNLVSKNLKERFERYKHSKEVGWDLYKLREPEEVYTEIFPASVLHHNGGTAVRDKEAVDQVAWRYDFSKPVQQRIKLTYGHFVPLKHGPGRYEARFRIKIGNNELTQGILEIRLGGSDDIEAESRRSYSELSPVMFTEANVYEEFPIAFTYDGETEMEYITEILPQKSPLNMKVWIDKIAVKKLD